MEIKVRPLITDDLFAVAYMLSKITKGAKAELAQALSGEESNPTEIGILLFQSVFIEAKEDLKAWLASLVGKTTEEFGNLPLMTFMEIIEALMEQKDATDFFARASQLAAKRENRG